MSKPSTYPLCYHLVMGLLYPGALGAVAAWLLQAVRNVAAEEGSISGTALLLGAWFVTYHCLVFARQVRRAQAGIGADKYTGTALTADLIECLALLGAFAALDLSCGTPSKTQMSLIFLSALLIPISAFVMHRGLGNRSEVMPIRWVLIVSTGVVSVCGFVVFHLPLSNHEPVAVWLGIALWSFLISYVYQVYLPEQEELEIEIVWQRWSK